MPAGVGNFYVDKRLKKGSPRWTHRGRGNGVWWCTVQSRGQLQHLGIVGPFRELVVLRDELCFFGEPLGLRVSDARTGQL